MSDANRKGGVGQKVSSGDGGAPTRRGFLRNHAGEAVGAVAVVLAALFAFSRSTPFDRVRLKADLENLCLVRELGLDDRALTDYLQYKLKKYPPGVQIFEKQFESQTPPPPRSDSGRSISCTPP